MAINPAIAILNRTLNFLFQTGGRKCFATGSNHNILLSPVVSRNGNLINLCILDGESFNHIISRLATAGVEDLQTSILPFFIHRVASTIKHNHDAVL